jgi:hypothetical protein
VNTSLYALTGEYLSAAETLANLDLDEQTVADTLEGLAGALEVKATNVAMFVRNLESSAEAIKNAEAEMAKRRKAIENRAERIRAYLFDNMQRAEISKIECPHFKLSIRENPASVVIDSEGLIPAEFMRAPPPPPPSPDKKAIADAIKAGNEVPGAHLHRTKRLEIR